MRLASLAMSNTGLEDQIQIFWGLKENPVLNKTLIQLSGYVFHMLSGGMYKVYKHP